MVDASGHSEWSFSRTHMRGDKMQLADTDPGERSLSFRRSAMEPPSDQDDLCLVPESDPGVAEASQRDELHSKATPQGCPVL